MKTILKTRIKRNLLALFILLAIGMCAGAVFYLQHAKQKVLVDTENELHTINRIKSDQVNQWLKERLSEANFFTKSTGFPEVIKDIVSGNKEAVTVYWNALEHILSDNRYENVLILNADGELSFSFNSSVKKPDQITISNALEVFRSGSVSIKDFYYCNIHGEIHYEIIAPVRDKSQPIIATVTFLCDPLDYLYPILANWTSHSKTAESYIVKRQGDSVVFLTGLRHTDNSKLQLSMSLDEVENTAVLAVAGHEGTTKGVDYRGERVIADMQKIPGTDWYIITEMDVKELFSEINRQMAVLFIMVVLSLFLVGTLVAWFYHLRQRNFYREILKNRSELYRAQEEFGATLYSIGDGVITTDQEGRIKNVNPAAEQLTGWDEADAVGRQIDEVFHIVNEETRVKLESPVEKTLREGKVVGFANHTVLISKSGKETPINDSGAPIKDKQGNMLGVVLVFGDQSKERLTRKLIDIRLRIFEYAIEHNLKETLTHMLDEIGILFQSPLGFFHFLISDQETLRLQAWSTTTPTEFCRTVPDSMKYDLKDTGVWADAVRQKKPVIHNDLSAVPDKKGMPDGQAKIDRELVVPVIRNNNVVALIGIGNKPEPYKEKDVETLSFLADVSYEIAEQKFNEQQLHQSEERFMQLFQRAPLSYQSLDESGNINEINQAWAETFGYSKEEVFGTWFGDYILPEDRDRFRDFFPLFKKEGKIQSEFLMQHKNGATKVILFDGRIGYKEDGAIEKTYCILRDITEHKQIEKKLVENEEKIRSIFRVAPTGIGVVKDRKMVEVNPYFCEITGYRADELINKSSRILYPSKKEFDDTGQAIYNKIAEHGTSKVETQLKRKDGEIIDVLLSSTPIDIENPSKGITVTVLDITQRKRSERLLKEHDRQLSSMVGNLPGFVYRCRYDKDWTMMYLSPGCETVTGYKPSNFIDNNKLTFNSIIRKEYQKKIYDEWETVIKNRSIFIMEYEIITANNHVKWIWERGVGVYDDDTGKLKFLEGYIEDITERKNAEKMLAESEQKFRRLFHGHAAIKFLIDPDNGRIVDANEAAAEFYGWSIGELTKMKVTEINTLPAAEVQKNLKDTKDLINTHAEFRHRKANGDIVDVENFSSRVEVGGKTYLHSIIHDISEKKKAEYALMESEEHNRLIMDNSMDAILLTKPDGSIHSANRTACKMFGMTEEEICRKGRDGLVDIDDPKLPDMLSKREKDDNIHSELNFIRKDGTKFTAEVSSTIFKNSKGDYFTSMTIHDITERKEWEIQLLKAKEKAEESDKLKTAFLTNMSHEIRTPMNGILGFLDLLNKPNLSEKSKMRYISIVNESGQRLLSTINDIIEISKIETGIHEVTYKPVNIENLMHYFLEFFKTQASDKGISLSITEQVTGDASQVGTDKQKLESVLTNLLKNAIKFTPGGSIEFGNHVKDDSLIFFVRDSGGGIPEEKINTIFDRFVQADMKISRSYEGSGLGLSIAKAYVKLMGGDIWVESEINKGSTFFFSIPYRIADAEMSVPVTDHKEKLQEPEREITLLIAEDDKFSYLFLKSLLSGKKFSLLHAWNGEEAIDMLKNHPEVSIILMDIKMPVLDGINATKEIRKFNPTIPIIAQTAYVMPNDESKIIKAGCNDYIPKPIQQEELFRVLNKYIS
ncbi:MAG: PAS domain S-box protein [Bacteroidales bacterium]|nr:PAS domain S-box protein [Bacteroidales bacterium]